jgi:hypothetical protein
MVHHASPARESGQGILAESPRQSSATLQLTPMNHAEDIVSAAGGRLSREAFVTVARAATRAASSMSAFAYTN